MFYAVPAIFQELKAAVSAAAAALRLMTFVLRVRAVAVATWVKKTFALRPALNRIRRQRAEQRQHQSDQVDGMF